MDDLIQTTYGAYRQDCIARAVHSEERSGRRLNEQRVLQEATGILYGLELLPDMDRDEWDEAVMEWLRPFVSEAIRSIRTPTIQEEEHPTEARKRRERIREVVGPERPDTPLVRAIARRDRQVEYEERESAVEVLGQDLRDELLAICEAQAVKGRPILTFEWTKACGNMDWEDRLEPAVDKGYLRIVRVSDLSPVPKDMPLSAWVFVIERGSLPPDLWLEVDAIEPPKPLHLDPAWLAEHYAEVGSIKRLAELAGKSQPTIRKALKRAGIETNPPGRPPAIDSSAEEID